MHPEEFLCRLWTCQGCGFRSPWWRGWGRFPFCTECEKNQRSERSPRVVIVSDPTAELVKSGPAVTGKAR
jgi:hypothetical protein